VHTIITGFHTFHYNSDLSGQVLITRTSGNQEEAYRVNGSELVAFVAEWVRRKKIAEIESQDAAEILGVTETP
jgi:hypothetical protein